MKKEAIITVTLAVRFDSKDGVPDEETALAVLAEQEKAWASEFNDGVSCISAVIEPHVDAIEDVKE